MSRSKNYLFASLSFFFAILSVVFTYTQSLEFLRELPLYAFATQNKQNSYLITNPQGNDFQVDKIFPPTNYEIYFPNIENDGSGNVYYLWYETESFFNPAHVNTHLLFRRSADFGISLNFDPTTIPLTIPTPIGILQDFTMCTDNNGHIYVAWINHKGTLPPAADERVFFTRSLDYGKTWQEQDKRIDTATSKKYLYSLPPIDCDEEGNIYIVWKDTRQDPNNITSSHIYFNRSNDSGATWLSQDIQLDHTDSAVAASSPKICTDNNGNVYAVWKDNRLGVDRIFFNYSANYGTDWLADDIIVDRNETGLEDQTRDPEIACDESGNVYVGWKDHRESNKWNIYFNYSSNYGKTWQQTDQRINNNSYNSQFEFSRPFSLATNNNGYVYAVWHAGLPPNLNISRIFFNYSPNFGANWSPRDTRIDSTPETHEAFFAQLSANNQENVYIAWIQELIQSETKGHVYFNYSLDNGATWQSEEIRLDSAPDNTNFAYDTLAISGNNRGHVYINWLDDRNFLEFDNPSMKPLRNYFATTLILCSNQSDFNCSGGIDSQDLLMWRKLWFSQDIRTNLDGREGVNILDYLVQIDKWLRM